MSSLRLPMYAAVRTLGASASAVRPRAALAVRSAPLQLAVPSTATRLLSTTRPAFTSLASSAGSGQGGKADKSAARKAKEQAKKDKDKAKAQRERERAKAKAQKEKEKEKEKLRKEKEKAKLAKQNAAAKPKTRSALRPPKLPLNTWGLFLNDYLADRKRELGSSEKLSNLPEHFRKAAQEYATIDGETKAELQRRADAERAAYPDILDEWKKTLTPEMIKQENAVRANRRKLGLSRKPNMRVEGEPKRPATAFMLYSSQVRAKGVDSDVLGGETNILEQSKRIAAAWRALSDADKKPFYDTYEEMKAQYAKDKAEFDAKHAASS